MTDAQLDLLSGTFLALCAGMVLFLILSLRLTVRQVQSLSRELDKERTAHNVTRDRLLASHKDGFLIPPAPPPEPVEDDFVLSESLTPIWDQWEAESSKKKMKEVLKGQINSGRSIKSLLEEYGFGPPQVEQE